VGGSVANTDQLSAITSFVQGKAPLVTSVLPHMFLQRI
jgi:hypothetical protein